MAKASSLNRLFTQVAIWAAVLFGIPIAIVLIGVSASLYDKWFTKGVHFLWDCIDSAFYMFGLGEYPGTENIVIFVATALWTIAIAILLGKILASVLVTTWRFLKRSGRNDAEPAAASEAVSQNSANVESP